MPGFADTAGLFPHSVDQAGNLMEKKLKAFALHLDFGLGGDELALQEFRELAHSAGVEVCQLIRAHKSRSSPKYFIGKGKACELRDALAENKLQLLLVNHSLSSTQERNLERLCQVRVLDRSGLILDIFAQRARSSEGKLQVELAQLEFLSSRLVRGWSHLERQKGGIGLRGPGEKQLEIDRRLIRDRIGRIKKHLVKIKRRRALSRSLRKERGFLSVALVGYSNAGKSTLFNALTHQQVEIADQLFTTLDSVVQRMDLDTNKVVLSDTVGFIQDLPHALIEAFNATLLEVREADLLVHVLDSSAPARDANKAKVEETLREIGATHVPCFSVNNKIDLLDGAKPGLTRNSKGVPVSVSVSASTGAGLDLLRCALVELLSAEMGYYRIKIPPAMGQWRAWVYAKGRVFDEQYSPASGWRITTSLQKQTAQRFKSSGLEIVQCPAT